MPRPLATHPLLQLLAWRAYAKVKPKLGQAGADPWCGLGLAVSRASCGEENDRTPRAWQTRWPEPTRSAFWEAHRSPAWALAEQAKEGPDFAELVTQAHEHRRFDAAWGHWDAAGDRSCAFGWRPAAAPVLLMDPPPSTLKTVGLVARWDNGSLSAATLTALEQARSWGLETWLEIPSDPAAWEGWQAQHWLLAQRLGVALWFHAPPQDAWPAYGLFLERQAALLARTVGLEQWAWPLADLLQQGMEETCVYGKPGHREGGPWPWEGRCKHPDWSRTRRQVWAAAQLALGGEGALEEILVATTLAHERLLEPPASPTTPR